MGSGLRLSAHGEQMALLPVHPRLAHLLLIAARHGLLPLAADLAALLSERDPLPDSDADLERRLEWLRGRAPGAAVAYSSGCDSWRNSFAA